MTNVSTTQEKRSAGTRGRANHPGFGQTWRGRPRESSYYVALNTEGARYLKTHRLKRPVPVPKGTATYSEMMLTDDGTLLMRSQDPNIKEWFETEVQIQHDA